MYIQIILTNDILGILAFLITATTSASVLSYLNNVSLDKKCLLLYLYKDFVTIFVSLRFFWAIKVILSNLDEAESSDTQAKILVFFLYSTTLALVLAMNLISSLKLIIAKRVELHPSLPCIGENETTGINKIRIVCALFVLGLLSLLFGLGLYPCMYYGLTGIQTSQSHHPAATILYRGMIGILLITCLSTWAGSKYYEALAKQKFDALIPRTINYFLLIAFFMMGFMLVWETLEIGDFKTRWNLYQFLITAGEVSISFGIILKSDKLKPHFKKYLRNKYDEAFLWNIILMPTFLCFFMYGALFATYKVLDI